MERITDIKQLKPGDKIWSIDHFSANATIIEFVCIHPHNHEYSVFLNINYDGMPKFYNKRLQEDKWYRYDGTDACWNEIHDAEIVEHQKWIENLRGRLK